MGSKVVVATAPPALVTVFSTLVVTTPQPRSTLVMSSFSTQVSVRECVCVCVGVCVCVCVCVYSTVYICTVVFVHDLHECVYEYMYSVHFCTP